MSVLKTGGEALQSIKAAPTGRGDGADWGNGVEKFGDPKFSGLLSRLMVSYSEHP
jgi:hypothetical protein